MAESIPMGIGNLGFKNNIFKRKFRFTFELQDICGGQSVPRHYVKTASHQWLLSEYDDPNVTLSLNTFEAQIEINALYENIDINA